MKPVQLHHSSIRVADLARSRRFYEELLGLRALERPDFGMPGAGTASAAASCTSSRRARSAWMLDPSGPHFAIAVADLDAARRELAAAGIETLDPGGNQLWLRDPDGNVVELTDARRCDSRRLDAGDAKARSTFSRSHSSSAPVSTTGRRRRADVDAGRGWVAPARSAARSAAGRRASARPTAAGGSRPCVAQRRPGRHLERHDLGEIDEAVQKVIDVAARSAPRPAVAACARRAIRCRRGASGWRSRWRDRTRAGA